MTLDELLEEMKINMQNRDLSDDYLEEHDRLTRTDIGVGEYAYGITMVPCEWVYYYLIKYKKMLEENNK